MKYLSIFFGLVLAASFIACGQSEKMSKSKAEKKSMEMEDSKMKTDMKDGMKSMEMKDAKMMSDAKDGMMKMDKKSFAVLELFTSEGCSSCPPADRLLSDVIEDADEKGLEVYALSFHVDYWNRLGWKDPYSSAAYSERQRNYARTLRSNVYTPQLVVNGKDEFVGSNRAKASMSIKKALDAPVKDLSLDFESKLMGDKLSFTYKSADKMEGKILNVALVESDLSQQVSRGENRGRLLKHDNVVRAFKSLELDALIGRGSLQLPEDFNIDKAKLIVYAQNKMSKEVVLAQAIELSEKAAMMEK
ncbi:MAG: DUF1223 domain-containing protein [Bacteroidota bacterium]